MDRLTPTELLTPCAPFRAYSDDVARLGGRAPLGPDDDRWLLLAQTLVRAAALPGAARAAVLASGAAALREAGVEGRVAALVEELHTVARLLADEDDGAPGDAIAVFCASVRRVVGAEERAGAFQLAFTTLAATRDVLVDAMDGRTEGLLLAQQGRVARQLGALGTARTLYAAAARAGRRAGAPDVVARAQLGLGALATMRGNYPEARTSYRRALAAARRGGAREYESAAHHGLLVSAVAAGDAETAIAHGWHAFIVAPNDSADGQAETLTNLAEVAKLAGQHRAALGACLRALELTETTRIRMAALGIAAIAAARLGEASVLGQIVTQGERIAAHSGQPYENAFTLVELAEACAIAGLAESAGLARRAFELADQGSFYEIALRAQRILEQAATHRPARTEPVYAAPHGITVTQWSPQAQHALRALEELAPSRRAGALVIR